MRKYQNAQGSEDAGKCEWTVYTVLYCGCKWIELYVGYLNIIIIKKKERVFPQKHSSVRELVESQQLQKEHWKSVGGGWVHDPTEAGKVRWGGLVQMKLCIGEGRGGKTRWG